MTTVENWDVVLIHGKHGRSGANICTGNQVEGAIFPWKEWVGRCGWMDGCMDGWMDVWRWMGKGMDENEWW